MTTHEELDDTIGELSRRLCLDSMVRIGKYALRCALTSDAARVGRLPTSKEIELMVTGDDDGYVPEHLEKTFKETCRFINRMF